MRFKILFAVVALLFSFSIHAQQWEKLNNKVLSYLGKGDYPNALTTALEAREIARTEFGENHADYSASLHNLASAHKKLGEYTPAEALYWEALKIDKRVLGVKHQNYALSLFGLANLYKLKKEYSKAESIYVDALEIMEKAVTNRHPDYALILGDFADLQTAVPLLITAAPRNALLLRIATELSVNSPDERIAPPLLPRALAPGPMIETASRTRMRSSS